MLKFHQDTAVRSSFCQILSKCRQYLGHAVLIGAGKLTRLAHVHQRGYFFLEGNAFVLHLREEATKNSDSHFTFIADGAIAVEKICEESRTT